MKHAILGHGNLGESIMQHIVRTQPDNHRVEMFAKPSFEYPFKGMNELLAYGPDFVWNCVGIGSVNEGDKFFDYQLQIGIGLANWQMTNLPQATHVFFTSDYAAYNQTPFEIKSRYGMTKMLMESFVQFISKKEEVKTAVFRVCNLYSMFQPQKNLVYRLIKQIDTSVDAFASANNVCMTDTDWLAPVVYEAAVAGAQKRLFSKFYAAPTQNTISVVDMAKTIAKILGKENIVSNTGIATDRPFSPLPGKHDFQLTKHSREHESVDALIKKMVKYYFMNKK